MIIDDLSQELKALIISQHELESAYNAQMASFQAQIDAGELTPEIEQE